MHLIRGNLAHLKIMMSQPNNIMGLAQNDGHGERYFWHDSNMIPRSACSEEVHQKKIEEDCIFSVSMKKKVGKIANILRDTS